MIGELSPTVLNSNAVVSSILMFLTSLLGVNRGTLVVMSLPAVMSVSIVTSCPTVISPPDMASLSVMMTSHPPVISPPVTGLPAATSPAACWWVVIIGLVAARVVTLGVEEVVWLEVTIV